MGLPSAHLFFSISFIFLRPRKIWTVDQFWVWVVSVIDVCLFLAASDRFVARNPILHRWGSGKGRSLFLFRLSLRCLSQIPTWSARRRWWCNSTTLCLQNLPHHSPNSTLSSIISRLRSANKPTALIILPVTVGFRFRSRRRWRKKKKTVWLVR